MPFKAKAVEHLTLCGAAQLPVFCFCVSAVPRKGKLPGGLSLVPDDLWR